VPRSLVHATDIDVLPLERIVARRHNYMVIRSPSNPQHYWGNLLLFDDPPTVGDGSRWERLFDAELGGDPRIRHRTFAWDRVDGALGRAREEFVERGYEMEDSFGLIANAEHVCSHPRENREVVVRVLDPAAGRDEQWWGAVVELQVAARRADAEARYRAFRHARLDDLRRLFRNGRGAWYVAHYPNSREPVASCGVVVTGGRGRFQDVDTAMAHRRRGICSRLLAAAARHSGKLHGAQSFVIVADPGYHAISLYESLGFERNEHVYGVCQWPPSDRAS